MLQRKQTLFLLLAVVLSVVCIVSQLGTFHMKGMGADAYLYNLFIEQDGGKHFLSWPLYAALQVSIIFGVVSIFLYRKRKLQANMCHFGMWFCLLWIAFYINFGFAAKYDTVEEFTPTVAAALPVVSMILYWLARRGVIADERLVRAADRIR